MTELVYPELVCPGLDGTNPLHVLAALGLLQLGSTNGLALSLHWRHEQTWYPVVTTTSAAPPAAMHATTIAQILIDLACVGEQDPVQARLARDLNTERKKLLEASKKDRAAAKEAAKLLSPEERKQTLQAFEQRLNCELEAIDQKITAAQDLVNDALGAGVAHLGDIIGVHPSIFRRKSEQACRAWLDNKTLGKGIAASLIADAMASQACDSILDDKGLVQNTPLSFSNGASGQCLLKAFRTLAIDVTPDQVAGTLTGSSTSYLPTATPLNWSPADQRDYALTWASPEDKNTNPKLTDVAANALALLGLSLLTACPSKNRLEALGWKQRDPGQGFTWPLWTTPLSAPVVRSLIASVPNRVAEREAMGIAAVFRAARINPTGKRNFFAPARPV